MTDCLLKAEKLSLVRSKKKILRGIDLEISRGDILALIGSNGAGKSSLILALAGLLPLSGGKLIFGGRPIASLPEYRRKLAVVFQDPLLLDATVCRNAALGLSYRGIKGKEADKLVDYWLERLGLLQLKSRKALQLSGGEAQRLAIARALVVKPEILFLDEPFANLDAPTRNSLREELIEILAENNITAVLVTHDFQELPLLANKVLALEGGSAVQQGSVSEILEKPLTESLARLVGMENLWELQRVERHSSGWQVFLPGGRPLLVNGGSGTLPVWAGIRPEKVDPVIREGANILEGTVAGVLVYGAQYKIVIDCGLRLSMMVSRSWAEREQIVKGKQLKVSVAPGDVHLIGT